MRVAVTNLLKYPNKSNYQIPNHVKSLVISLHHVLNVINNLQIYIYNINNITLIKLLRNLDMF